MTLGSLFSRRSPGKAQNREPDNPLFTNNEDPPLASVLPSVTPQRILIVLLGAIGDVTRALPLLTQLRRAYPQAHIAWAVEPAAAPLLDSHPALNEVLLYRRTKGVF